jgi:hypothetical protein
VTTFSPSPFSSPPPEADTASRERKQRLVAILSYT